MNEVVIVGSEKFLEKLKGMKKKYSHGFERGARKAMRHLQAKSLEVVPIDTGVLRKSNFYHVENRSYQTIVSVGYNENGEAPYAMIVHESLTMRHEPGKEAKYLEGPYRREFKTMMDILKTEAAYRQ